MKIEPQEIDPMKLKQIEACLDIYNEDYSSTLFKRDIALLLAHIKYLEIPNSIVNKDFETDSKGFKSYDHMILDKKS